jgi:SurA N-terminal domain/PPIC-type PPIASE domain
MIKKIKKVRLGRKKATTQGPISRITNETIAEHREQILQEGRKFKYPVQYARNKLVINTILIGIVAFAIFALFSWWQLYVVQNTSGFFYRIAQLTPLSVARVDGESVRYSDYLLEYRSSIYWLQQKTRNFSLQTEDGQRQSQHIKRQSLDSAIEAAYATKLARDLRLTISKEEVDDFVNNSLQSSSRELSQSAYEEVLSDAYGVSVEEYRGIVSSELLQRKVAFAIDAAATKKLKTIQGELVAGKQFGDIATSYSDDEFVKENKGDMGFVPKTNADQGLVAAASKLPKGSYSEPVKVADAYYIVQHIDSNDTQVRYAQIKVQLREFDQRLSQLKKEKKIQEYISLREK